MGYLPRLLVFVFVQSFASAIVQRGVYFFTQDRLEFSPTNNLWLALGAGIAYIAGALPSHRVAKLLGERRALVTILVTQALAMAMMSLATGPAMVVGGMVLFSMANGMGWPIAESYASAGRSPAQVSRALGYYNMAWSFSLPMSVFAVGALIANLGFGVFMLGAVITAGGLAIVATLPAKPTHHPADHPDRPSPAQLERLTAMMASSRWSMVGSYALLFVLSPLMPERFAQLGVSVAAATAFFCLLDVGRALTFAVMQQTQWWHNRRDLLAVTAVLLPIGFFLTLNGPTLGTVIIGELIFGIAAGLAYYGALYYAMVVSNASVDAGGAHEGLIGSGFSVGPLSALVGRYLGQMWHQPSLGIAAGVAPVIVVAMLGALLPLIRRPRQADEPRA